MIISILLLIILWFEYTESCEKSKELNSCYSALLQQQKKINELESKLNGLTWFVLSYIDFNFKCNFCFDNLSSLKK